jgi:DNA invertase Pin-like site-specific DNA recombinase
VSRDDQSLDPQLDALRAANVGRVYAEHCSGIGARAQWQRLLEEARPGDTVVVVRLDRIGRRMAEVVASVQALTDRGIHVRTLAQPIDTSQPGGAIVLGLFAALAETEREILRERTIAGLEAARSRGRAPGRKSAIDRARLAQLRYLLEQGHSLREIARTVGVSAATVSRALRRDEQPTEDPRQLRIEGA